MCGIAGIQYKQDVSPQQLDAAAAHFASSLHHRGPDAFGVHRNARAVFANLRLAIVDRSGGDQPIYAPHEPGRKPGRGIVYNGEVYNWQALRQGLNYPFSTQSDTEVVLASVLAHGDAGLAQLNGMFGLCVWDDADGSFLLARDRFGAKPLYVYEDAHCIAFASELRTLLGLPGLDHTLDPVGFQDYLSYRYNLAPHTFFKHIRKLPAGCALRFADGQAQIRRYADVVMQENGPAHEKRTEADFVAELDERLGAAVRSQLMGEVPLGVLLSGGLDSSAIAAYVHKAGARLKAYSIGFPEVNEFEFSRAVARQFELDYVEVTMTQQDLRSGMDTVLAQLDEPIADPACFALSRLCESIRQDVTVVLSGEGGDEMFAGYHHHQLALQPEMAADRNTSFAHFFHQSASFTDANRFLRDKTLPPHHLRFRPHFDQADNLLNGMQQFELHTWMPENLMMKADKVLMAHSLEGRFPFLDLDLYRFASALPAAMKLPHAASSKHVLRQLMSTQLPASVIERRKMGFTVPPTFLLQPLQERLLGAVESLRRTPVAEVLDLDALQTLVQNHYQGGQGSEQVPVFKVWSAAVLLLWWADVYPRVKHQPVPSSSTSTATVINTGTSKQKLIIYTALVGPKETLANPLADLPPGATTDLELDFVCITDNPALRSPVWRFVPIGERHLPPEKLSRRPKAMPHEYFPEAEFSLYIDNTVSFKRLPQAQDLETKAPYLFRAFRHATRQNPGEEAAAIAMLGYDDVATVCGQLDFYAGQGPLEALTPLTTGTVLLRQHHQPQICRFGVLWWESVLAFSKRDQLSVDYALHEAGVRIDYWPGATHDSPLIHWRGSLSQHRVKASFDAKRYAWLHRHDAQAVADPKAHFLATASGHDEPYLKQAPLLDFICHQTKSSLGSQVSPRRGAAPALETLLGAHRREGQQFLLVRVQGSRHARGFSAAELDAAAGALSMYLHPARGTQMDLPASDLQADGTIYTSTQTPYDLVLLLGAGGSELQVAARKLQGLARPEGASFVAVLTQAATLAQALQIEQGFAQLSGTSAQATLHSTTHDDERAPLPNSVLGVTWRTVAQAVTQAVARTVARTVERTVARTVEQTAVQAPAPAAVPAPAATPAAEALAS